MIIFDLDGTLADCEHRRHFVDPLKALKEEFKPNWPAFYDACDQDTPIMPVINICNILRKKHSVQIWSGRSATVIDKTMKWLRQYLPIDRYTKRLDLLMRPVGDNTPDDQLKEKWLDKAISEGKTIDFVVDDRPKVVRMWRRRGIFVFDVNQTGKEL